jgi:hypothetical protein
MGVSGQHHAPAALLPPGKGPPVPIVQEAGWAPEPVWTQRLEEKSFCPCRGSNPDRPVVQPVLPELTWLLSIVLRKKNNNIDVNSFDILLEYYLSFMFVCVARGCIFEEGRFPSKSVTSFTYHSLIRRYIILSYWKKIVVKETTNN